MVLYTPTRTPPRRDALQAAVDAADKGSEIRRRAAEMAATEGALRIRERKMAQDKREEVRDTALGEYTRRGYEPPSHARPRPSPLLPVIRDDADYAPGAILWGRRGGAVAELAPRRPWAHWRQSWGLAARVLNQVLGEGKILGGRAASSPRRPPQTASQIMPAAGTAAASPRCRARARRSAGLLTSVSMATVAAPLLSNPTSLRERARAAARSSIATTPRRAPRRQPYAAAAPPATRRR